MKQLNLNYILSKFFAYAGSPVLKKNSNVYNASCNICREGHSWLKKQRLFFYPQTKTFYCFNCSTGMSALQYISKSSGLSYDEIFAESDNSDFSREIQTESFSKTKKSTPQTLPHDSISLLKNEQVLNYYRNNKFVTQSLEYIKKRRLDKAINRPSNFYISLTDYVHQNRLIIPFLDLKNKITFYQSRSLMNEVPKYLSKLNAEKTLYGINNIDPDFEYIFLFEGPIDAMFVKNGIAVGGLNLTTSQQKQLNQFPFHEKIWILDNPKIDIASREVISNLVLSGQKVFKWNNTHKDFNDWATAEELNFIDPNVILNNIY